MTMIRYRTGCKVAWETFDNEAEAEVRAVRARQEAAEKWARGYDFGYQVPGGISYNAVDYETGAESWTVTLP